MATPIPSNRASFTLQEVALATGGTLQGAPELQVRGVSTDSRADLQGQLFVALRGAKFDGHAFVNAALQRGASAVLCEEPVPDSVASVRVADTLDALGKLARHHRRRWGKRIVAVAGSAGKTTTRSVCTALLRELYGSKVHAAAGNLNNRIGVPMVLLGLQPEHELCVLELGTNQTGEMPALVEVCEPDIGVLTLIDLEHSEGLGDLDAIEEEEAAIFARPLDLAVGNGDDPRVMRRLATSKANRRIAYGQGDANQVRLRQLRLASDCTTLVDFGREAAPGPTTIRSPLLGAPGALAVLAAVAVTEHVAGRVLAKEEIETALTRADARQAGRLVPTPLADGTLVIDDSYNANPASVRASLDVAEQLARLRGVHLHLVLGEMRELGAFAEAEHDALLPALRAVRPQSLLALAGHAERWLSAVDEPGRAAFFESSAGAAEWLLPRLQPGDVVLVKASRGVRAELVVEALSRSKGPRE
jgi:UDP-N-acetylmuramoyl-tripeptide--D-alanyl-D-alanine ligase